MIIGEAIGRVMVKVAPLPCCEEAWMVPAACSMSCLQTQRPRPVPLGVDLAGESVMGCVTNGSKSLSAIFAGMPGPESVISMMAFGPTVVALMMMEPPDLSSALRALRMMFRRT